MLNSVVKISMMSAMYFEYYTIMLRGGVFLWTRCMWRVKRLSWVRSSRLNAVWDPDPHGIGSRHLIIFSNQRGHRSQ